MKLAKLDAKQVPQVIVLGVLCVGVFGYGALTYAQWFGIKKPSSEPPGTAPIAIRKEERLQVEAKQDKPPDFQLPSIFNPDPFKPTAPPQLGDASVTPREREIPPEHTAEAVPSVAPKGSSPPGSMSAPAPASKPTAPAVSSRPKIALTGTSVVGKHSLAIVEIGTEHRVVQAGDLIADNYRVVKIELSGILLSNGKDRFFVPLGSGSDSETVTHSKSGDV